MKQEELTIFLNYNIKANYINNYGWQPYTPSGLGINQFSGGTRAPNYQYEQHLMP